MTLSLCSKWPLIDIAVNMTDDMFSGKYNGRKHHDADIESVLERACVVGVRGLLLTGCSASTSAKSIELCKKFSSPTLRCLCTVGCHPTHCTEFLKDPDGYFTLLDDLLTQHSVKTGGCVAAIGELGLDYDRLFFCTKEIQLRYFQKQLELATRHQLPLFLHDRNTNGDFLETIKQHRGCITGGVVHSFTGSAEELQEYLALDLYIGVNGCSLKTEENLQVVKQIPLDRVLLETDAPWCDVRGTHASRALLAAAGQRVVSGECESDVALGQFGTCRKEKYVRGSMVKGRCEPCNIAQVLEVLFELHRGEVGSMEELARMVFANTCRLFAFSAAVDEES